MTTTSSPHPTVPPRTNRRMFVLALLILAGIAVYWPISLSRSLGRQAACDVVCLHCDLALYEGHELMDKDPDLLRRDRIFSVHHRIYPQAVPRVMNVLTDVAGSRKGATWLALTGLGVLFLAGGYLLYAILTGDPMSAALAVLLAALTRRGYPSWGLPHMKPNEFVGCASPLLLYVLYRGLTRRGFAQLFAVLAVLLAYVHPPTGLILLGVGALSYAWLGRGRSHYRESLLQSGVLAVLLLVPLVVKNLGGALTPPPLSIMLARSDTVFFPTRSTVLTAAGELLLPALAALLLYPRVKAHLTEDQGRFMKVTAVVTIVFCLASSLTYVVTSLARLPVWLAYRYLYVAIFAVMAMALRYSRNLGWRWGAVAWAVAIAMVLNLDGQAVNAALSFRNQLRGKEAPEAQAAVPAGRSERCYLTDVGLWAQQNTKPDDLFLVPPFDADAGFRVVSHRAVVVCDKDGGPSAYDGTSAREWLSRDQEVEAAYKTGLRAELDRVARKYAAQFILVKRSDGGVPEDAVFQNEMWVVLPTHVPVPS